MSADFQAVECICAWAQISARAELMWRRPGSGWRSRADYPTCGRAASLHRMCSKGRHVLWSITVRSHENVVRKRHTMAAPGEHVVRCLLCRRVEVRDYLFSLTKPPCRLWLPTVWVWSHPQTKDASLFLRSFYKLFKALLGFLQDALACCGSKCSFRVLQNTDKQEQLFQCGTNS